MKWSYDGESDALYIMFRDVQPTSQLELTDGLVVDIDDVGRPTGLEVLGASTGWSANAFRDRFNEYNNESDSVALFAVAYSRPGSLSSLTPMVRLVPTSTTQQTELNLDQLQRA